jgi:hypothetical protein
MADRILLGVVLASTCDHVGSYINGTWHKGLCHEIPLSSVWQMGVRGILVLVSGRRSLKRRLIPLEHHYLIQLGPAKERCKFD